jgi:hypothetical protein
VIDRAILLLALPAVLACNSTVPNSALGEFSAPAGASATGAGDRDVLFIANSGRDGLRALQLCNAPLLANGAVSPADTCPTNVNGQFIPAPIRVFAATIETGHRPIRVAGVRLKRADNSAAGVALAAGSDSTVAVVDARSLVETQFTPGAVPKPILYLGVDNRTIDVVAANPVDPELDVEVAALPGATVPAFVATTSQLLVLDVSLDTSGNAQVPTIRARCDLAPVVPTRIAVVPGGDAQVVYVADGVGDGVVSIATSSIAGGPCTMHRISAGGRSVRSVSVSPRWYDENGAHGPGDLLTMVVEPLATAQPGRDLDPGGVLFAATGTEGPEGLLPIPPFVLSDTTNERMQPLSLPGAGLMLEGAFLRSVKPRPSPLPPDLKACTAAPCTPLYVGTPTTAPTQNFSLLAVATASDGGTYFFEVLKRRFVNANLYAAEGDASLVPIFGTPVFSAPNAAAPAMLIDPASGEPGVTRNTSWRVIWHSPIPDLDRRGGLVTTTGHGTLLFKPALTDLAVWQGDPAIALAVGDVVSFGAYSLAGDGSAACQNVVTNESAYRFELPILAIDATAGTLELGELPDNGSAIGFHPDACTAFGAVAEVRTGGAQPWLVFDGSTAQGRVQPDNTFVAHQRRFDYPRSTYAPGDAGAGTPPQAAASNDVAFKFNIVGTNTIPRSGFAFTVSSGQVPVGFNDSIAVAVGGLATSVTAYSSPRVQSLVFTSITGGNEILQADPSVLSSNLVTGLVAYR